MNRLGVSADLSFGYSGTVGGTGGTYGVTLVPNPPETRRNADTTALGRNQISLVPLDGDWTAKDDDDLDDLFD